MALGFAPAMLGHLETLTALNYPGLKITPAGFTSALLQNNPQLRVVGANGESISDLKLNTPAGHIRDVRVKYLKRIIPSQVGDEISCDNNQILHYDEQTIAASLAAQYSFYIDWGFAERYTKEASNITSIGEPSKGVLGEVLEQLMHVVNGLVGKIDTDLLGAVAWGTNIVPGNNAVKAININKDSNVFDLSNGIVEILSDAQQNEMLGELLLVGNGLMNKFEIARGAIGTAQNGLNLAALQGYKWYHDIYSASGWGANYVGAFAKGTIGLVDIDSWIGWKTGPFGTSHFATIMLPVNTPALSGQPQQFMRFNVQIKEHDCPFDLFDGYVTRKVNPGVQVIITKRYGLWQMPSAHQATDRLNGHNGAIRFQLTNDCVAC